jgi:hypothetical protein
MEKEKRMWNNWQAVPLKSGFMLTAILGFFISFYFVYPETRNFGMASMLVFILMFIASLFSLQKSTFKR